MSGAENPQREKEIDSPSFKGFHAQFTARLRTVIKIKHS